MQRQPKKLLDQVCHIIRLKHYSMSKDYRRAYFGEVVAIWDAPPRWVGKEAG